MTDEPKPYTEAEVIKWPELGPMNLDMWRMLATVKAADERDALRAQRDAAVEALRRIISIEVKSSCPIGHVYDDCSCRETEMGKVARAALLLARGTP